MKPLQRAEPSSALAATLAVLMFLPVFVQLDGSIYTDAATLTAPRGAVTNLPIPLSVPASMIGLALMLRLWWRDSQVLLLGATIPLMIVTSLVAGGGTLSVEKAKLLSFQFGVPLAGFAIGRHVVRRDINLRPVTLSLLALGSAVMSGQLLTSWLWDGIPVLPDHVFGIGIYGHRQYVPAIILASFLVGLFGTWQLDDVPSSRVRGAAFLVPIAAFYAGASMSMTTILGLWLGLLVLVLSPSGRYRRLLAVSMLVTAIVLSTGYVLYGTSRVAGFRAKFFGAPSIPTAITTRRADSGAAAARPGKAGAPAAGDNAEQPLDSESHVLPNVRERFYYWQYFATGSTAGLDVFLFGHAQQPDIRFYPSAHNYYLDFLYNFGAVAMIPLVLLLLWTTRGVWLVRETVLGSASLLGLAFATVLLVLIDNNLKVGMRQPYPGIATFFFWGMLATIVERMRPSAATQQQ